MTTVTRNHERTPHRLLERGQVTGSLQDKKLKHRAQFYDYPLCMQQAVVIAMPINCSDTNAMHSPNVMHYCNSMHSMHFLDINRECARTEEILARKFQHAVKKNKEFFFSSSRSFPASFSSYLFFLTFCVLEVIEREQIVVVIEMSFRCSRFEVAGNPSRLILPRYSP
jgi:hypothetical protein